MYDEIKIAYIKNVSDCVFELIQTNPSVKLENKDIIEKLKERDKRDKNRKVSPLICTPDAIVFDNSEISFEKLNKEIIEIVEKKYKSLNLNINIKKMC